MTAASIITQVNDKSTTTISKVKKAQQHLPDLLNLCLRGIRIDIDRDILVGSDKCHLFIIETRLLISYFLSVKLTLPESILVVMFPQGFVLDGQDEEPFCNVDFSVECLNYILSYYRKAQKAFKANYYSNEFAEDAYLAHAVASGIPLSPLLTKQGIIILREELEFFIVPRTKSSMERSKEEVVEGKQANNSIMLSNLKKKCGQLLVKEDLIFEALLKSIIEKEKLEENVAEYHLIDMLCTAGFSRKDHWSFRATEPNRTCITSLSLVSLCRKNRLHVGQKLMMFGENQL
jgi:hypothetical protein